MTCHTRPPRPASIVCADCEVVVEVKSDGPVPTRCIAHRKKAAAKQSLAGQKAYRERRKKGLVKRREDPRELGPERPLLGRTQAEQLVWKAERLVAVWRAEAPEGGITVSALAERFGLSEDWVCSVLNQAGVYARYKARAPGQSLAVEAGGSDVLSS